MRDDEPAGLGSIDAGALGERLQRATRKSGRKSQRPIVDRRLMTRVNESSSLGQGEQTSMDSDQDERVKGDEK